jgi:hypothetical protein
MNNERLSNDSSHKQIGILTGNFSVILAPPIHALGGGDCPGLNAVIRAVVLSAARRGVKCVGFLDGFEGVL